MLVRLQCPRKFLLGYSAVLCGVIGFVCGALGWVVAMPCVRASARKACVHVRGFGVRIRGVVVCGFLVQVQGPVVTSSGSNSAGRGAGEGLMSHALACPETSDATPLG